MSLNRYRQPDLAESPSVSDKRLFAERNAITPDRQLSFLHGEECSVAVDRQCCQDGQICHTFIDKSSVCYNAPNRTMVSLLWCRLLSCTFGASTVLAVWRVTRTFNKTSRCLASFGVRTALKTALVKDEASNTPLR